MFFVVTIPSFVSRVIEFLFHLVFFFTHAVGDQYKRFLSRPNVIDQCSSCILRAFPVPATENSPCCIVAAVGDGMTQTTGVSGRFFQALGNANVNVLAIAQVGVD